MMGVLFLTEILQKYKILLIILSLILLTAVAILLFSLTSGKKHKIPLRGVFVNNIENLDFEINERGNKNI